MELLIEDVAVQIQQLLQRAKQEFGEPQHHLSAKARAHLEGEIHRLEEQYALPAVDQWLRKKLCLSHLARIRRELTTLTQRVVTHFEAEGRPAHRIEEFATELRNGSEKIAKKGISRLKQEAADPRIFQAVTSRIEEIAAEFCEDEALEALFTQ